ncbi:MAG: amino acid ABC transporter ATP-binding protein [Bacilli bacterium]|nr:amino acid ABC transporter ATP-binding protein [Bacilli bacterium]
MSYLEIRSLRKSFDGEAILQDVSFSLEKGETFVIIGKSGCGKTTLLRCLNGLEDIDSGQILIEGKPYNAKAESSRRFGLVFQSFNLFPQYTAIENVRLPLDLEQKRRKKKKLPYIGEAEVLSIAKEYLAKVGLADKVSSYPGELSGGQQQRVAIARAMALRPDVLCFDEPTSALDPVLSEEVARLIRELKLKYGLTMIVVTHEMNFARQISDRIMFMKGGAAKYLGKPEDIFAEGNEEVRSFLAFDSAPLATSDEQDGLHGTI